MDMMKLKNVEDDYSTWSLKKCDEHLKANKVMRVGNLKELRKRCNLFQLLSDKNLHHVMTLSKPQARQACSTLNILEGSRLETIQII